MAKLLGQISSSAGGLGTEYPVLKALVVGSVVHVVLITLSGHKFIELVYRKLMRNRRTEVIVNPRHLRWAKSLKGSGSPSYNKNNNSRFSPLC